MKERGILMAPWCVRAMLAKEKTQTRRLMKPQPTEEFIHLHSWQNETALFTNMTHAEAIRNRVVRSWFPVRCPYAVGDHLWVKEALCAFRKNDGKVVADYAATHTPVPYVAGAREGWYGQAVWQWQRNMLPSMFMPKWAARIWREVTAVRAERVQDISEADAWAEGVYEYAATMGYGIKDSDNGRLLYQLAWDSINAKRGHGWGANDWVWVYDLKPLEEAK